MPAERVPPKLALRPDKLDMQAWAQVGQPLSGQQRLSALPRLVASLPQSPTGEVSVCWQAGLEGSARAQRLHLRAEAEVTLVCQRCLEAMIVPLVVDRHFRFAPDEASALALDDDTDDEVLVEQRHLDLHALLEDELILALPLVARHGRCPEPLAYATEPEPAALDASIEAASPHPFAALAALKTGKSGSNEGR
jgi:uncharacterized protein